MQEQVISHILGILDCYIGLFKIIYSSIGVCCYSTLFFLSCSLLCCPAGGILVKLCWVLHIILPNKNRKYFDMK